ncbi:MAG: 50S ribosomal protein L24e [Candidatus Aenigmarchaeota archaeon]|nr:50S ribosomal protein L24e [Candidatus Aenigmarchaeota archaeon]
MSKCSFCNKDLERGTGSIVIKKDGKILYFDSKKCEKNLIKLGRDPKRFKWANN